MPSAATIAYGLAGAASWGTGDFCGGLATRRTDPFMVIVVSQFLGLVGLVVAALALQQEIPTVRALLWGCAVGGVGIVGITALYRGLGIGPMSIVAPISGVLAAGIPIPFAAFTEGAPAPLLLLGLVLGLVGIWLVARGGGGGASFTRTSLLLGILAGASFGVFYIFLDQVGESSGLLWTLAAARVTSVVLVGPYVLWRGPRLPSDARAWSLVAAAGLLDAAGNVFFVLVTQLDRLDVSALLLSLYPAATATLAFAILKERLAKGQIVGLVAMVAAIVLMVQ